MSTYLESLFGLNEKVAVVTGGGGLIGAAFCRWLARAGARVGVLGRTRAACEAVVASIREEGGEAVVLIADVLDERALERACSALEDSLGRLDVLVNNAGGPAVASSRVLPETPLFDNPALRAGTRAVVELNLLGPILTTFAFGDLLAAGEGGAIVNISSNSARKVSSGVFGYSGAKAGLEQLTRWLAVETAHRYGGRVRVNAIAPGFTAGLRNRARYYQDDGSLTDRARAAVARIPAGRLGTPEDLVPAMLFLAGPGSAYLTGQVVAVDGGHGLDTGV